MRDPFDLLGVPPRFDVDAKAVRAAWLRTSSALHPDRLEGGAGDEGENARRIAELNGARRVLDDPEKRANALLERLGGPSKEEDTSLPPTFLMEIMETRQGLEKAQASGGDVGEYRAWAEAERAAIIERLSPLFDKAAGGDAEELGAIRELLNVWRYLERMLEQINEHE